MGEQTVNYGFWMPEVNDDEGQWGTMLNTNWFNIDLLLKNLTGESKSIIIEDPTASEDISFFFADVALTIAKIRPILQGTAGQTVTWTIRWAPQRNNLGTEVITGGTVTTDVAAGADITTFDAAAIPANSHVWIETTAKGGTVDSLSITLFYDED